MKIINLFSLIKLPKTVHTCDTNFLHFSTDFDSCNNCLDQLRGTTEDATIDSTLNYNQ